MGKDINQILKLWSSLSPGQTGSSDEPSEREVAGWEQPENLVPNMAAAGSE